MTNSNVVSTLSTLPVYSPRNANITIGVAILWLLMHAVVAWYLATAEFSLRTDILELLYHPLSEDADSQPQDSSDIQSSKREVNSENTLSDQPRLQKARSLQFGAEFISQQNDLLRFVVNSHSLEEVLQASRVLKLKLSQHPKLRLIEAPSREILQSTLLGYLSSGRLGLLPPSEISDVNKPLQVEEFTAKLREKLFSPLASFYAEFLPLDPLLLLPELLLEMPMGSVAEPFEGMLLLEEQDWSSSTLFVTITDATSNKNGKASSTPLDIDQQKEIVSSLNTLQLEIMHSFPQVEIRWSGLLAFAYSSAQRMEADLRQVSMLGSLMAVILLLYSFRSFAGILLPVISVLSGILFGAFFVSFWTSGIHLLTLGIGISIMGACIDYSLHYLTSFYFLQKTSVSSESSCSGVSEISTTASTHNSVRAFLAVGLQTRSKVITPIFLGALTSIFSFLLLCLSGFPGLIELSLFAVGSLGASGVTVLVFGPLLLSFSRRRPAHTSLFALPIHIRRFVVKSRRLPRSVSISLIAACLFCIAIGLSKLGVNDDIRALQEPSQALIENERWIAQISGATPAQSYLLAVSSDPSAVAESLYYAHGELRTLEQQGVLESFQSIYGLIPPISVQRLQQQRMTGVIEENRKVIAQTLESLGYSAELRHKALSVSQDGNRILSLTELLALLPTHLQSQLGVVPHGSHFLGAIPLFGVLDVTSIEKILKAYSGLYYFEPRTDISSQFSRYRVQSTWLVTIAYFCILATLCWRYGIVNGLRAVVPMLTSTLIVLSVLGYLGEPISFFSLLALLIVLGLSVDFAIFNLEASSLCAAHARPPEKHPFTIIPSNSHEKGTSRVGPKNSEGVEQDSVEAAIILSALTTTITFGLLALSSTAVLHTIGLIVGLGVSVSLLVTLLLFNKP